MAKIGDYRQAPYDPDFCPRCLNQLPVGYPGALSRADNLTEVCSACGTDEAFIQMTERRRLSTDEWPIASHKYVFPNVPVHKA